MDTSFMSKARTAFHSATAKAEKAFTEIKALDFKANQKEGNNSAESKSKVSVFSNATKELPLDEDGKDASVRHIPKKIIDQEFWKRYLVIDKPKKQSSPDRNNSEHPSTGQGILHDKSVKTDESIQVPEKDPVDEEAYAKAFTMVSIPSSSVLNNLASAINAVKGLKTMAELTLSDSVQGNDRSGIMPGFSAMKILSIREKDENAKEQLAIHQEDESLISSLFESDMSYCKKNQSDGAILYLKVQFPEQLCGTPPWSFVYRLAELMGSIKRRQRMGGIWLKIIDKLKRYWDEAQPIPWLPLYENPDLKYCLLHQKLQVINCCIARKRRRSTTLKMLNSENLPVPEDARNPSCEHTYEMDLNRVAPAMYAKLKTGEIVQRQGVLDPEESLTMLETGEPVFSPITQEGPIMTDDLINETEELILRTGSVGAGCSQLLSDMQAFKAANPGCILEDFVRWYSPPDWKEGPETPTHFEKCKENKEGSSRGRLSRRMRSEGNLWRELWDSAKPVPAAMQTPIFDEELAGEGVLSYLEEIAPWDLFEQLFVAVLSSGFAIAEAAPATKKESVSNLFTECKKYVINKCCRQMDQETIESLCQVYETVEKILIHPHEEILIKHNKTTENRGPTSEPSESSSEKLGIRNIRLGALDKHVFWKRNNESDIQSDKTENDTGFLSRLVEGKSSLFGKKPQSHNSDEDLLRKSDSDWTFL